MAEMLIASSVAVIVIAGILMLTQFSQYMWKNERAKSNLLSKLQIAMENMQKEIRQTDGLQIFYCPTASAAYTAISFPLPADSDGDGFMDMTSDDPPMIVWGKTIIYHTCLNTTTGKTELRRTVFSRRRSMTDAQRQAQLDDVAAHGYPTDADNPEYSDWDQAGSRALCDGDNLVLAISSTGEFDGYSPTTTRSENVSLGSIELLPGGHVITFNIIGTNALSTGSRYGLGIDSFSITPSGCAQEAEEAVVVTDYLGSAPVIQDMSTSGNWSGNRYLEYQATGDTDHLSLNFYYDKWIETNFSSSLPYSLQTNDIVDNTVVVEYSRRTGDMAESLSGGSDYVARLNGYDSWSALNQTGPSSSKASESFTSGTGGLCFRNIIMNKNISGRAISIIFDNTALNSQAFTIDYASIRLRSSGGGADEDTAASRYAIKFGGFTAEGSPVTIGTALPVQSDWIEINNFHKDKDYLLTFHVQEVTGDNYITCWTPAVPSTADDQSYYRVGTIDDAKNPTWPVGTCTPSKSICAAGSITASYFSSYNTDPHVPMTLTSQVYDTHRDSPVYGTLTWNIAKNNYGEYDTTGIGPSADMRIRLRSGSDENVLKASTDWTTSVFEKQTKSVTGSETTLTGIGSGRYCQFQAEFFSVPSPGGDYPKSCALKNLSISWPGQKRIVDVSGYFTRKSDYGIFSVQVDGHDLKKTLEIKLEIAEKTVAGRVITKNLTIETEPRNTGK